MYLDGVFERTEVSFVMSCSLKVKLQPIIAQFDLVLFASLFFITPVYVAWSLSGSTHFQSQYSLFIENFVLITWSLDKEVNPHKKINCV